ncbi:hypothetical protein PHYPSEUDO_008423 [Phytophthora pseudosyringae]|uniref:Uncharacterized protein n=1 Tax=Phytophthora pseudosyringae TaxID=221518 RepID=A0A8T1WAF3_9STRA|nr:hypothetical protein PHYPSEUDO_008423 [Phytophthora pseudosyringae]
MGLEELVVTGAYVSGAVCIVLFTLTISWLVVWKCVLAKMPFVQELFDLKQKQSAAHDEKSISFQDRYEAYKRVRQWLSGCTKVSRLMAIDADMLHLCLHCRSGTRRGFLDLGREPEEEEASG